MSGEAGSARSLFVPLCDVDSVLPLAGLAVTRRPKSRLAWMPFCVLRANCSWHRL